MLKAKLSLMRHAVAGELLEKRKLSDSTLKTYVSLLVNLYLLLNNKIPAVWVGRYFKQNAPFVCEAVNLKTNMQTRATTFSALWVLTGSEEYQEELMRASDSVRSAYEDQTPIPLASGENGIDVMRDTFHALCHLAKESPTPLNLTNALLASVYSGQYENLPPRRLQDYAEMRIDGDPTKDNCFAGDGSGRYVFIFNVFKTAKHMGGVEIRVPQEVADLAEQLLQTRQGRELPPFLLLNTAGGKFTSASLHKRLVSLYGFGVDRLRSFYITEMHKGTPKLKKMEETAHNMGHSVEAQMLFYAKH